MTVDNQDFPTNYDYTQFAVMFDLLEGKTLPKSTNTNFSFIVTGGNSDIDMTDCHKQNCSKLIESWRESVIQNSILLPEGMELVPMQIVVRKVVPSFVNGFNDALLKIQSLRGLHNPTLPKSNPNSKHRKA